VKMKARKNGGKRMKYYVRIKTLLLCLSMALISPFMADCAVNLITSAENGAGKLRGLEIKKNKLIIQSDMGEISKGYGWEEETEESGNNVITTPDTKINEGEKPYPRTWNPISGKVLRTFYGKQEGTSFINLDRAGQVRNVTGIQNSKLLEESRKKIDFEVEFYSSEPQVLIMHTHTTESFEPYERENYDDSFNYRTTDPTKNMTAVGAAIARELEKGGIKTIHSTQINDYPSYNGSYERSRADVKKILAENPSVKIVLDVHRDAITDGKNLPQPVAEINGKNAAQVMIISCCDDGSGNIPDYMKNFRFAALFQQQAESEFKGLTRPVLFDTRKYNQDLTTGSLLIEVGSHGNTIEQVVYSGELLGKALVHSLQN